MSAKNNYKVKIGKRIFYVEATNRDNALVIAARRVYKSGPLTYQSVDCVIKYFHGQIRVTKIK